MNRATRDDPVPAGDSQEPDHSGGGTTREQTSSTTAAPSTPTTPTTTTTPGAPLESWFWVALGLGLALRLFFSFATPGTLDVDVWKLHTIALENRGLISYYQGGALLFNHPPPAAWFVSGLAQLANLTGISFATWLRLPFSLFDLGSVWLILRLLADSPQARIVAAAYWLHPLAILYSSYHGNTDTSVAFFLLATTLLISQNKSLLAGLVFGLSLWFKIPGILVGPVFFFALPSLKQRTQFCIASAATLLIGFGNALFSNARAVVDAVFLYPGLRIHTSSGITTWGLNNLLPSIESIPPSLRLGFLDFNEAIADYNTVICLAPIFVFGWLRRRERTGVAIAASVAGGLSLFYGLTSFWAFQYLAWAVPFWLLSSRWFAASASLFATLYIYGAYVWLTGDPLLLGTWDFIGKPDWPDWLIAVRNLANTFFLVAGCTFLIRAIAAERAHRRELAA